MEFIEYEERFDDGVLKIVVKYRPNVPLKDEQKAAIKRACADMAQRVKNVIESKPVASAQRNRKKEE